MRHIKVFCFALLLVLCSSIAVNGQNEASLSSRIFEALKAKEPGWKAIGGIENHPPRAKRKAHFLCGVRRARSRVPKMCTSLSTASRTMERQRRGWDEFAIGK